MFLSVTCAMPAALIIHYFVVGTLFIDVVHYYIVIPIALLPGHCCSLVNLNAVTRITFDAPHWVIITL